MEIEDLEYYRYKLESVQMMIPGKDPIEIEPFRVDSMEILKDYDGMFYPVYRFSVTLRNEDMFMLIKNKTNVKFHVRLIYYMHTDGNGKMRFKKNVFDEIFTTYLEEETPNLDEKTLKSIKNVNHKTDEDRDLNDFGSSIELYLFKEKDLTSGKTSVNAVYSNAKIDDVVTHMLSSNGVKKVLMSPFDNKAVRNEIWVPPSTVIGGLSYLEQHYGFYNTFATIFFDIDVLYFLSRKIPATAWIGGERKRTTLMVASDLVAETFFSGTYEDNDNYIVNVTKHSIVFNNSSVVSDQVAGNNMVVVDQNAGSVNKINSNTVQRGDGNYQVLVNTHGNNFIAKCEEHKRTENSKSLTINLKDFDVEMFTPNKEFMFIFKDGAINKEYGGLYRLTYAIHKFVKHEEEFFLSGTFTFKSYNKK